MHTERGRVAASFAPGASSTAAASSSAAEHFRLGWRCFQRVLEAAAAATGTGGGVHFFPLPKRLSPFASCAQFIHHNLCLPV